MATKGYTNVGEVATFMGKEFDPIQAGLVELSIEAAETRIDNAIRHAWLEEGPIIETVQQPQGLYITLSKPPIISVEGISIINWVGADPVALDADCGGWHIQNHRDGKLIVPFAHHVFALIATYTPNTDPVPADIHMAAMALAAFNMRLMPAMLDGVDPSVIQRYVVGGELEVEFRKSLVSSVGADGLPAGVSQYLDRWLKNYSVI